ncbi:MAG: Crp/Fnr family transcriptional regulator [Acidobacteriota bacterium]|jgi:CRP/FNR family transcriptional regulator|nr:Crp/Fnr family transcriptional regulator [Acidobacteriota bacterium]
MTTRSLRVPGLSSDERDILTRSPLVKDLSPELQERLLQMGVARKLHKGEFLFMEGDPVRSIHCLLAGKLKEYYASESGESCLRCIQVPGSHISLHVAFTQARRHSYHCEALSPSTCFSWDVETFKRMVKQDSALAFHVASALSGNFEDFCRLTCICRKPQALPRVAEYLLHRCANCDGCPGRDDRPGLSADLRPLGLAATDICLARETFSRALAALQKKDVIRLRNGIVEIRDLDALKRISAAG